MLNMSKYEEVVALLATTDDAHYRLDENTTYTSYNQDWSHITNSYGPLTFSARLKVGECELKYESVIDEMPSVEVCKNSINYRTTNSEILRKCEAKIQVYLDDVAGKLKYHMPK